MPHETLNRLLEYSHKNIAMEVENHYIERKERLSEVWHVGLYINYTVYKTYTLYIIYRLYNTALPKNWVWKIKNQIWAIATRASIVEGDSACHSWRFSSWNLICTLGSADRIIMKTNLRIFKKMIVEKLQHHQRSSSMLLFRLMISRKLMGPPKQTAPKD